MHETYIEANWDEIHPEWFDVGCEHCKFSSLGHTTFEAATRVAEGHEALAPVPSLWRPRRKPQEGPGDVCIPVPCRGTIHAIDTVREAHSMTIYEQIQGLLKRVEALERNVADHDRITQLLAVEVGLEAPCEHRDGDPGVRLGKFDARVEARDLGLCDFPTYQNVGRLYCTKLADHAKPHQNGAVTW